MGKRSLMTGCGLAWLALGAALARPAVAQDSQYWSIQYGPVGQLVGGQLIGGVSDLSATFYNPGSLSVRNESSYLLSSEAIQSESFSTKAPPAIAIFDTSSSTFGAAPSLLAGALPAWLGENTRLAWSFLTRQKLDLRLGQRSFNSIPAWEKSAAESYLDQRVTESWAGLTVSHRLSKSSGLGLTWYGINRGQRTRKEISVQGIGRDSRSLSAIGVTDFDYSHNRTLAKLGYAWQSAKWNAGLSVTTPSIGVMGSGRAAYTLSTAGVDADGDGRADLPTLAADAAEDLEADYRSSWAIGAGGAKLFGSTRLFVSAEWFAPVGTFTVIALPAGSASAGRLTQNLRSVLNAGLAFEHMHNQNVSFYGAFHTDFTAATGDRENAVALSDLNLYHLSGGASFKIQGNRFTLGALFATGGKTRALESPLPPTSAPGYGLDREVEIHYTKVTVLLGFEFRK